MVMENLFSAHAGRMPRFRAGVLVFGMLLLLMAASPVRAQAPENRMNDTDLDRYRWSNRVLLIFAPAEGDAAYRAQRVEFDRGARELDVRDVVRLDVLGPEGRGLRERFSVPTDRFLVVLVGRDGTEKLRRPEPVRVAELMQVIDAMPMGAREAEARRRRSGE